MEPKLRTRRIYHCQGFLFFLTVVLEEETQRIYMASCPSFQNVHVHTHRDKKDVTSRVHSLAIYNDVAIVNRIHR